MEQSINSILVKENLADAILIEDAIRNKAEAQLSSYGSLVIKTGNFTGRAANDKYVVLGSFSTDIIDWSNNINKMDQQVFKQLKQDLITFYNTQIEKIYFVSKSVCADPNYSLGVNLYTNSASHALFANTIFREAQETTPLGDFTIFHCPDFEADKIKLALKSTTVIAINFETKEIIIVGTGYAGEIKKSIFSVLNTLLPAYGVLPMHTGANQSKNGNTSLFFGLSGTGKTTLSTDVEVDIIGDDEHGLSNEGIFNFEGGCYAKTDGLKQEKEPDIFKAVNQFKCLLENVKLDPVTRKPLFDDKSITENGRATYSLEALDNTIKSSRGAIPNNIFFLSADALGVLPAISRLNTDQAMYYFLTGYTAKLAGTEIGLKGATTAFSHCFGAPFMMRKPNDYAELLKKFLTTYPISVWLINTGWYGGVYGEGQRYPLSFTRSCIRAIQKGLNETTEYQTNEIFSLRYPVHIEGVDAQLLNPKSLWKDEQKYKETALGLKNKFDENFKKFIV